MNTLSVGVQRSPPPGKDLLERRREGLILLAFCFCAFCRKNEFFLFGSGNSPFTVTKRSFIISHKQKIL